MWIIDSIISAHNIILSGSIIYIHIGEMKKPIQKYLFKKKGEKKINSMWEQK